MTDAETGPRGYLLTENPDYLAPLRKARRRQRLR
ncbi:MAG: CHASE3 domain-containing protein [Polaromonas sp.]|nr:CHASE3 domain-containing protein [Polaromonas sp.]